LHDWPKLTSVLLDLVKETTDKNPLPSQTFSRPIFSLMQMAAQNNTNAKYLAIEENFLLAAIHVAAMKDIPFAEGILPDLPSNMPLVPAG
jgi:hypothetical protein